jgi:hypothetical protein
VLKVTEEMNIKDYDAINVSRAVTINYEQSIIANTLNYKLKNNFGSCIKSF